MTAARKPVVSIVDDDGAVRASLCDLFDAAGCQPLAFEDGLHFMRSEAVRSSDVIITDIQMCEMDGFGLIDAVGRIRHVPVIVITACTDEATRKEAMHRGCFAFLRKPFDPAVLVANVERALGGHTSETGPE